MVQKDICHTRFKYTQNSFKHDISYITRRKAEWAITLMLHKSVLKHIECYNWVSEAHAYFKQRNTLSPIPTNHQSEDAVQKIYTSTSHETQMQKSHLFSLKSKRVALIKIYSGTCFRFNFINDIHLVILNIFHWWNLLKIYTRSSNQSP